MGALPNRIINSLSSSFSITFKISDSHPRAFSKLPLCTSNSTYPKLNSPFPSHPDSFCIFATLFFLFFLPHCVTCEIKPTPPALGTRSLPLDRRGRPPTLFLITSHLPDHQARSHPNTSSFVPPLSPTVSHQILMILPLKCFCLSAVNPSSALHKPACSCHHLPSKQKRNPSNTRRALRDGPLRVSPPLPAASPFPVQQEQLPAHAATPRFSFSPCFTFLPFH